jgi:23S rRNA (pseudouridine1915-N3)-methyltransferase
MHDDCHSPFAQFFVSIFHKIKYLSCFPRSGCKCSKYENAYKVTWIFQKWTVTVIFGECMAESCHFSVPSGWDILLSMLLTLAHVGSRSGAKDLYEPLIQEYVDRCSTHRGELGCRTEGFRSEKALLEWLDRQRGRTPAVAVLLDEGGRQMSSEAFARWLGGRRDEGAQQIVFAVGPADGWTEAARARAQFLLSLGPMTLAHRLARLVIAEQIYRALTILSGHPYHRA